MDTILNKTLQIAQIIALVGIPIVLLIISSNVTSKLKRSELSLQYVRMAVEILRQQPPITHSTESNEGDIESNEGDILRGWATKILAEHSPVPISDQLLRRLASGKSVLPRDDSAFEENLGAANIILKEASIKPQTLNSVKHDFDNHDDLGLQNKRQVYLNVVTQILHQPVLTYAHAVALWLAGIELHNSSLKYKNWDSDNLDRHLDEFSMIHEALVKILLEEASTTDSKLKSQILSYLEIHLHNYRSYLNDMANHRNR